MINDPARSTTPSWAMDPIIDFVLDHTFFYMTMFFSRIGLEKVGELILPDAQSMEELFAPGLRNIGDILNSRYVDVLSMQEGFGDTGAKILRKEVKRDFPTLRNQTVVHLWGAFEDFLRSYLIVWLENDASARNLEVIADLSAKFDDETDLEPEDRYPYIIDRLERRVNARYKKGVWRYESLLEPFGLSGEVDERTSHYLLEMQQVRHILVHRRGVADRRLLTTCPWLNVEVGDQLFVDRESQALYHYALSKYELTLLQRVTAHFGDVCDIEDLWRMYDKLRKDI